MVKKILIIHPEGNMSNNLNLYAILNKICEKEYEVDYICWGNKNVSQRVFFKGMKIFSAPHDHDSKYHVNSRILECRIDVFIKVLLKIKCYSFIVGIDEGIVPAAHLSRFLKIPYGQISYEIYPYNECENKLEKEKEIESCRDIEFAVTQDSERAKLLSRENRIPLEKILKIPLGGLDAKKLKMDYYLHEKLGIEKDKKIAIVMGSIAEWTMVEKIVDSTQYWNEDWVLVIHGRYKNDNYVYELKEKNKENKKVFFSETPVETCEDMGIILASVSAGFAFYHPVYKTKWDGMNLEKIGMASGKISTFLRHGVPIIINEIGEVSEYVRKFKLGKVVIENEKIDPCFSEKETMQLSENCINFYEKFLDFKNFSKILNDAIFKD